MSITRITTVTTVTEVTADTTTETVRLFTFNALAEDAQDRVVSAARDDAAQYMEADDLDGTIRETWAYALAEDGGGEGSRPDLEDMVKGWDIGRGDSLDVVGTLTPENAPKLPWSSYVDNDDSEEPYVILGSGYGHGIIVGGDIPDDAAGVLTQAVRDAMSDALSAGRAQSEYLTSEEYARERLEDSDDLYTEEGERA